MRHYHLTPEEVPDDLPHLNARRGEGYYDPILEKHVTALYVDAVGSHSRVTTHVEIYETAKGRLLAELPLRDYEDIREHHRALSN